MGRLFLTYAAAEIALAQKMFDNPACAIIERADSTNVRFIRSDTPFCWGECDTVNSCLIRFSFT